jgi:aryl-alcohol dehydrogenase-like predicted oxidoreductase
VQVTRPEQVEENAAKVDHVELLTDEVMAQIEKILT